MLESHNLCPNKFGYYDLLLEKEEGKNSSEEKKEKNSDTHV